MIVLLDHDGLVVGTFDSEPPATVYIDGTLYDFEAKQGDDHIYRERAEFGDTR